MAELGFKQHPLLSGFAFLRFPVPIPAFYHCQFCLAEPLAPLPENPATSWKAEVPVGGGRCYGPELLIWQLKWSLDSKLWNWKGAYLMSTLRVTPEAASDPQAPVWAGKGLASGEEAPHPQGPGLKNTQACLCLWHVFQPHRWLSPVSSSVQLRLPQASEVLAPWTAQSHPLSS